MAQAQKSHVLMVTWLAACRFVRSKQSRRTGWPAFECRLWFDNALAWTQPNAHHEWFDKQFLCPIL